MTELSFQAKPRSLFVCACAEGSLAWTQRRPCSEHNLLPAGELLFSMQNTMTSANHHRMPLISLITDGSLIVLASVRPYPCTGNLLQPDHHSECWQLLPVDEQLGLPHRVGSVHRRSKLCRQLLWCCVHWQHRQVRQHTNDSHQPAMLVKRFTQLCCNGTCKQRMNVDEPAPRCHG